MAETEQRTTAPLKSEWDALDAAIKDVAAFSAIDDTSTALARAQGLKALARLVDAGEVQRDQAVRAALNSRLEIISSALKYASAELAEALTGEAAEIVAYLERYNGGGDE